MENATRALTMAGGILIALLIIGALLLAFNNLSSYQNQMDSNESEFHKIPLVKKLIVEKNETGYLIKEDKDYDCK